MGIGGDGDIVVVIEILTAVVRVAVVIRSNLSNCMFGGGICGVGRGSGVNSGCGGSTFSHHHHYYYHQHHHNHHHHNQLHCHTAYP